MPGLRISLPRVLAVCAVLCVTMTTVACGSSAAPRSSLSPSPSVTSSAQAVFVPGGSAEQNLPVFTQIVDKIWKTPDQVHGRAYIDALVAAGFAKTDMQVTQDTTTVGNPAESIQFSVKIGQECLIGQVGPTIPQPVTGVFPVTDAGTCLLGITRVINW